MTGAMRLYPYWWPPVVPVVLPPPVVGLDSPVTPPPLTSFTGFRSRISRSRILPFLSRRQTERITAIFGVWDSIANSFLATFTLGSSTDTLLASVFIAPPLLEIARMLVRFDHFASFIVNADHEANAGTPATVFS
jgi:hypothetical protein